MVSNLGKLRRTNSNDDSMIWQVSNQRRYSVWICQGCLVNLVKQKGFQLTSLMSMVFKFINVDFMVHRIQTSMALEIEQIEVGLTSQVIQMRRRLKALQV
jgi:hypothetical protein